MGGGDRGLTCDELEVNSGRQAFDSLGGYYRLKELGLDQA